MTPERIKQIEALLDRGEWKYTWHLPKDQYRNTEWRHPDTIKEIREQIKEARREARGLLALAEAAEKAIGGQVQS